MAGTIGLDPMLGRLERVLDLRVEQHNLHTANLANASTPNYRAREQDFSSVLGEIMQTDGSSMPMSRTDGGHLGGKTGAEASPDLLVHEPPPWSLDGNSVVPEQEMIKMMENNLMFNATARILARKLEGLRSVISEGR